MKYNDNGTYKDIYVKAFDTLPVGAIVEYSGSTIPSGWTDIGNNQIQKTSQYMEGGASLSNVYGTSNENGYTQSYINGVELYSTSLTTSTGFYTGSETISEDIKNFRYIDVWAKQKGSNARCMIFRYFVCNNQIYRCNIFIPAISGTSPTGISWRSAILEISGTTATITDNNSTSMTPTNIASTADGVAIVKIIGYK